MNRSKSFLYALLCVSLWALIPVVSKLGQRQLDNHQFLFWSSVISFIACLLCLIFSGRLSALTAYKARDWAMMATLGFLGAYLYYILLYFGYARAQGMEVLILQYSWPVFVVFLSVLLLRERLTLMTLFAVAAGFAGALLIISSGGLSLGDDLLVYVLVVAGAFSFALFSVLSKKVAYEPIGLVTIFFFVAAIFSFFSMWFFSDIALPTRSALPAIFINGSLVNGISYILWLRALRYADANFVAPFVFLTPIISTLYLVLFFAEPLLWIYIVALALVVLSGVSNTLGIRRE